MKRLMVVTLAKIDSVFDELLYRPGVVRAFEWLPRWWLCDLAKLSIRLDERWATGYWGDDIGPGGPCDACGRRASVMMYGGLEPDEEPTGDYLERHPVDICGWCRLDGPLFISDESDLERALAATRAQSVGWRWRRSAYAARL